MHCIYIRDKTSSSATHKHTHTHTHTHIYIYIHWRYPWAEFQGHPQQNELPFWFCHNPEILRLISNGGKGPRKSWNPSCSGFQIWTHKCMKLTRREKSSTDGWNWITTIEEEMTSLDRLFYTRPRSAFCNTKTNLDTQM